MARPPQFSYPEADSMAVARAKTPARTWRRYSLAREMVLRRQASLIFALWLITGCAKSHNGNQVGPEQFVRYTIGPKPTPTITWPTFLAEDYREFSGRTLTPSEVALIRKTLALVKPCQRPLLRFAFPPNGDTTFVLYFQSADGNAFHVLWTRNLYFRPDDGTTFAMMVSHSNIRSDIADQPCA